MKRIPSLISCLLLLFTHTAPAQPGQVLIFRNFTLIDGRGGVPIKSVDMLVTGNSITTIGPALKAPGARIIEMRGKTIMPTLISTHTHVGTLKGTTTAGENYTRQNILRQLKKYSDYGISTVMSMGTDRPLLFRGLLDSSMKGLLPGATMYSAGFGFGVPQGGPPLSAAMDRVNRPADIAQARAEVDSLQEMGIRILKLWVDDFNGSYPKMRPEIYRAIITRAHQHGMRVASHLFYLEDAQRLVDAGIDIIAHSIRDQDINEKLLKKMKEKGTLYIPTLSLDEYAYIYARRPEWINDPFFKASLEPGVYEMISSKAYQEKIRNSPDYGRNEKAFATALRNLKRIFDAGILVSLGTDSGASPVRTQGFSEHLELELMVQAGLTPLQAITVGTKNAAKLLGIDGQHGTIEEGKKADFIVLEANPADNIRNTRKISSVWIGGKEVR